MILQLQVRLLTTAALNNIEMKFYALILTMLLSGSIVFAQNDPVLMTIGGRPVTRSEFEYAYLKNNPQNGNEGIAMKDFLKQFVNYKLKVRAALDAKVDTTANFKQAFSRCWSRAVPISVPMVSSGDREVSAHTGNWWMRKTCTYFTSTRPKSILIHAGKIEEQG